MFLLIDIGIALLILAVSINTLIKTRDKVFSLLSLFSLIVLIANLYTYTTGKILVASSISNSLLIIGASWLHWKKYNNRIFFYFAIGAIILLISQLCRLILR